MSNASMTCALLYVVAMWPDRRFRDTPPHFAHGPGDVVKCFSIGGKQGHGRVGHHVVCSTGTGWFDFLMTQWVWGMVLMIACERDCCVVVRKWRSGGLGVTEGA